MKKKLIIVTLLVFGFLSCAQNEHKGPDTGGARPIDQRHNTGLDTSINTNKSVNSADSSNRQQ